MRPFRHAMFAAFVASCLGSVSPISASPKLKCPLSSEISKQCRWTFTVSPPKNKSGSSPKYAKPNFKRVRS